MGPPRACAATSTHDVIYTDVVVPLDHFAGAPGRHRCRTTRPADGSILGVFGALRRRRRGALATLRRVRARPACRPRSAARSRRPSGSRRSPARSRLTSPPRRRCCTASPCASTPATRRRSRASASQGHRLAVVDRRGPDRCRRARQPGPDPPPPARAAPARRAVFAHPPAPGRHRADRRGSSRAPTLTLHPRNPPEKKEPPCPASIARPSAAAPSPRSPLPP